MGTKWVTTWKSTQNSTWHRIRTIYIFAKFLKKKLFKLKLIVPDCLNDDTCYKITECLTSGFNKKVLLVTSITRTLWRAVVPSSRMSPGTQDLLILPPHILCISLMLPLLSQDGCSSSKHHILTNSHPATERKEHGDLSWTYCFLMKKGNIS